MYVKVSPKQNSLARVYYLEKCITCKRADLEYFEPQASVTALLNPFVQEQDSNHWDLED